MMWPGHVHKKSQDIFFKMSLTLEPFDAINPVSLELEDIFQNDCSYQFYVYLHVNFLHFKL